MVCFYNVLSFNVCYHKKSLSMILTFHLRSLFFFEEVLLFPVDTFFNYHFWTYKRGILVLFHSDEWELYIRCDVTFRIGHVVSVIDVFWRCWSFTKNVLTLRFSHRFSIYTNSYDRCLSTVYFTFGFNCFRRF